MIRLHRLGIGDTPTGRSHVSAHHNAYTFTVIIHEKKRPTECEQSYLMVFTHGVRIIFSVHIFCSCKRWSVCKIFEIEAECKHLNQSKAIGGEKKKKTDEKLLPRSTLCGEWIYLRWSSYGGMCFRCVFVLSYHETKDMSSRQYHSHSRMFDKKKCVYQSVHIVGDVNFSLPQLSNTFVCEDCLLS